MYGTYEIKTVEENGGVTINIHSELYHVTRSDKITLIHEFLSSINVTDELLCTYMVMRSSGQFKESDKTRNRVTYSPELFDNIKKRKEKDNQ